MADFQLSVSTAPAIGTHTDTHIWLWHRGQGRGGGQNGLHPGRPGAAPPPKGGPGTDILEKARKAGKPIPPQMEKYAAMLDSMNVDTGEVRPGCYYYCCCYCYIQRD